MMTFTNCIKKPSRQINNMAQRNDDIHKLMSRKLTDVARCLQTAYSMTLSNVLSTISFTLSTSLADIRCKPTENIDSRKQPLYLNSKMAHYKT